MIGNNFYFPLANREKCHSTHLHRNSYLEKIMSSYALRVQGWPQIRPGWQRRGSSPVRTQPLPLCSPSFYHLPFLSQLWCGTEEQSLTVLTYPVDFIFPMAHFKTS